MPSKRSTTGAQPRTTTTRDTGTAERIVRVTLRRIRQGGFASVSMRQVANELGITATALYHHYADKNALLDRVAELVYDSIPVPDRTLHWTERLRRLVLAQQRAHLDHPGLARFVLTRRMESPAAFRWIESILQVLRDGGLDEGSTLVGLNQMAFLINPVTFLDAPPRRSSEKTFGGDLARRRVLEHPERFPCLASMLDQWPDSTYDIQFAQALDGVIAGLEARIERGKPRDRGRARAGSPVR